MLLVIVGFVVGLFLVKVVIIVGSQNPNFLSLVKIGLMIAQILLLSIQKPNLKIQVGKS